MKNNSSETKIMLEKALQNLPPDQAMQSVRFHLKCALNEIIKVEGRRQKREVVRKSTEENYKEKMNSFFISSENAPLALNAIDKMIAQEQNKLDAKKNQPAAQENDEEDTILG
jgi:hypothetical protein